MFRFIGAFTGVAMLLVVLALGGMAAGPPPTQLLHVSGVVTAAVVGAPGSSVRINHQGVVTAGGVRVNDPAEFRFAVVDRDSGLNRWTNDGTNEGSTGMPISPVTLSVFNGIYDVVLGDTGLTNMTEIPATVFDDANLVLRIWFDDTQGNGVHQLAPDHQLTSTPYPICPGGVIPRGGIIIWSGSIASIPAGWALCDGTNGTPDLQNRFVVGASVDDGDVAKTEIKGSPMQTGGQHQVTLTVQQIPPHTHSESGHGHYQNNWSGDDPIGHSQTTQTGSTGGGQPHENCPPFFALAYIMKL